MDQKEVISLLKDMNYIKYGKNKENEFKRCECKCDCELCNEHRKINDYEFSVNSNDGIFATDDIHYWECLKYIYIYTYGDTDFY